MMICMICIYIYTRTWIVLRTTNFSIFLFTLNNDYFIRFSVIDWILETITSIISMTFFHICDSFKFNDYMYYPNILCVSVIVERVIGL